MAARVPRLPKGALWGEKEGLALAKDRERRQKAARYWVERFKELEIDPRNFESDAIFALPTGLPDKPIQDFLKQHGLDRSGLTSKSDGGLDETGCLLSLNEIARAVGTKAGLQRDLNTLSRAAEGGEVNHAKLRNGFRVARELFDLSRRILIAQVISRKHNMLLSEALALYREETGFAIAPPQESWSYAPLIPTAHKGCRLHAVTLEESSTERPGFNLVHRFNALGEQLDTDESGRLAMLWRNLSVTSGLDAIVYPMSTRPAMQVAARRDNPYLDELAGSVAQDFIGGSGINNVVDRWVRHNNEKLMSEDDVRTLVRILIGLVTAETDLYTQPPDAPRLFAAVRQRLDELMTAHAFTREGRDPKASDCFLTDDNDGKATRLCLDMQGLWYATRGRPYTLLALADRSSAPKLPNLSPFMTYLRFHAGEVFFMRLLLRTLARLPILDNVWQHKRQQWSDALPQALQRSRWDSRRDGDRFYKLSYDFFRAAQVRGKVSEPGLVWHGFGFRSAVKSSAVILPPRGANELLERLGKLREVVRETLAALAERKLLVPVSVALEFTPLDALVKLECVQPYLRSAVAKAQGFERLRLAYEIALQKAAPRMTSPVPTWEQRWPWRPGYEEEPLPDAQSVGTLR